MAQQTILIAAFENQQGQVWFTYDDVSLDGISVRVVNTSATRTLTLFIQRGTRPVQSFAATPGTDRTFALPTQNNAKYTYTLNADGSIQESNFRTWAQWD